MEALASKDFMKTDMEGIEKLRKDSQLLLLDGKKAKAKAGKYQRLADRVSSKLRPLRDDLSAEQSTAAQMESFYTMQKNKISDLKTQLQQDKVEVRQLKKQYKAESATSLGLNTAGDHDGASAQTLARKGLKERELANQAISSVRHAPRMLRNAKKLLRRGEDALANAVLKEEKISAQATILTAKRRIARAEKIIKNSPKLEARGEKLDALATKDTIDAAKAAANVHNEVTHAMESMDAVEASRSSWHAERRRLKQTRKGLLRAESDAKPLKQSALNSEKRAKATLVVVNKWRKKQDAFLKKAKVQEALSAKDFSSGHMWLKESQKLTKQLKQAIDQTTAKLTAGLTHAAPTSAGATHKLTTSPPTAATQGHSKLTTATTATAPASVGAAGTAAKAVSSAATLAAPTAAAAAAAEGGEAASRLTVKAVVGSI